MMSRNSTVPFLKQREFWIIWALAALALASIPASRGEAGLIWDALNHHIYLGWIAAHPRFDRDFMAAGGQSYQYPYLYWPAYELAIGGASGVAAGVVFALLQSLAVPPLWIVARCVCPGPRFEDVAYRFFAVALALSGGVTLSLVDTTSNDVLAGIPLVWAVAVGLVACDQAVQSGRRLWLVAISGACAGVSVACKLSNGPLALVLPALWACIPSPARTAATRIVIGGTATIIAFLVFYGPWGWAMWHQFGNPLYPFCDHWFDPVRYWLHWSRP